MSDPVTLTNHRAGSEAAKVVVPKRSGPAKRAEIQTAPGCRRAPGRSWCLQSGTAMHLGECPGELTVLGGCAWLTRSGDPEDYFLLPGQHVVLSRGHGAVIESATKGLGLTYCWRLLRRATVEDLDAWQRRSASAELSVLSYGDASAPCWTGCCGTPH